MKTAIVVFPGTNREKDMSDAITHLTGKTPDHIWHKETSLAQYDLIVLPGGFSYGDYLRCGAMAAHSPIMKEVLAQAKRGTRIFGVCNGFQMLVETQILPGALLKNKSLKFICKHVHLKTQSTNASFTKNMGENSIIHVPVAHGDGNYFANDAILSDLKANDQIAFKYCDANGNTSDAFNPNGSTEAIAGIFNKRKTILGMMPHPENAICVQHANQSAVPLFKGVLEEIA